MEQTLFKEEFRIQNLELIGLTQLVFVHAENQDLGGFGVPFGDGREPPKPPFGGRVASPKPPANKSFILGQ